MTKIDGKFFGHDVARENRADGEITAKGSLNVRAILDRRAHLVTRLYDDADPATIHIGATR